MTFIPFIIWTLIFLFFILIIKILFNKLGIIDLGVILSSAHFIIVCIFALIVYLNFQEAQIEFIWFILMVIDFPIIVAYSTTIKFILSLIGYSKYNTAIFAPAIFFGTFGTLQYFVIGKILTILFNKNKK